MLEIALAAALFTGIVMCLALLVLAARRLLVLQGEVGLRVNERLELRAPLGRKLLAVLLENGVQLPSACGGSGTCGLCGVGVDQGAEPPLPIELASLPAEARRRGVRLACQLTLRGDLVLRVPEELVGMEPIECVVRASRNVSSFIKEFELALPEGRRLDFEAGAFVQVHCPPYRARFADFEIDAPYAAEWQRLGLRELVAHSSQPATRGYSLANHPGEAQRVLLDVRIATPPPGAPPGTPPGVVSSWLFSLKPGDPVTITGPFGNFFASEGEREMVFVGGGAGMAPMRSHIFDQLERLKTGRTLSFWYGARSRRELFYVEAFDELQARHANFRWRCALSQPLPDDDWDGPVGFIHQVLHDEYLARHPAPEACEYYLCGPPLMVAETRRMLDDLGVDPQDVHFDDFGT